MTHPTLLPSSSRLSSMVAWSAMSGMEKAMDGIWLAYSCGMVFVLAAEKVPAGTFTSG